MWNACNAPANTLVLEIAPAHMLPPPKIVVTIPKTKKTVDAQNKAYTQYEVSE